jgi:hypothetical protein
MQQLLQEKTAAVKQTMERNQAALRQYSWTSHTEISLKGEVKKTKDDMCRYGPDGQVQKTPIGPPAPQKEMHGLKKRIVEKKTDELEDYMERAVTLIRDYVPPTSERIEGAKQAGNMSLGEAATGSLQLQIRNYLKPGDSLVLTFDAAARILRRVNVNTYLDNPKDAVTLDVEFQTLPDGTNYAAATTLNAPEKKLQVVTQNANYQRIGG